MAADLLVCWIDRDYDRAAASTRHGRYAAYLVGHAELFKPWRDAGADGITLDPVDFAIAAFQDSGLVLFVTLAVPAPLRLPWNWQGWQQTFLDNRYIQPPDTRPTGLCRLELRWPVPTSQLPAPTQPRLGGVPNPRDATRTIQVLVDQLNATAGPVLAELEAGG
jgi:hypothetical protein